MVIAHNILAINSNRQVGIVRGKLAKSTEKLSSGYKVNRAADDAAGLAISEKMRKKIRGLEKGMENVQDGISLCQVADGALHEVTDLLQRMRELSIKAYNGTNSKSDRQTIQDEIDECITEVDRIFETTKFNEIYIFQNGTEGHGTYWDVTPCTVMKYATVYRDIPDWLKINDTSVAPGSFPKIEEHNYTNPTQRLDKIMKHDFWLSDGSSVKLYFGANQGNMQGYRWVGDFIKDPAAKGYGELLTAGQPLHDYIYATDASGAYKHLDAYGNYLGWTPTITDNVSAKIDFSELVGETDPNKLYDTLSELVGTEISFPCGTCTKKEAIRFAGEYVGFNNLTFFSTGSYLACGTINLSEKQFNWDSKTYKGYFEAIEELMAMDDSNPDKSIKTNQLSSAIAQDLTASTVNVLQQEMNSHYDKVVSDPTNPFVAYVYDYRDSDAVPDGVTKAEINTAAKVSYMYEAIDATPRLVEYDYFDEGQIWIQASDEVPDGMPILSKYLSINRLGLKNYTVNAYKGVFTMLDPDGYERQLEEWAKKVNVTTEIKKQKVTVANIISPAETEAYYENGEVKIKVKKPAVVEMKEVERDVMVDKYDIPKPLPQYSCKEVYAPSDLKILDDAIATICKTRSYYGACQNRLEHTYRNNNNAHENLTYAESRIRDTDMAEEMVAYSNNNILLQAGQSMLAQANQSNQGVLSLIA